MYIKGNLAEYMSMKHLEEMDKITGMDSVTG
jgi:hypothetical protein